MRSLNNIVQADLADASDIDTSSNHTAWAMTLTTQSCTRCEAMVIDWPLALLALTDDKDKS